MTVVIQILLSIVLIFSLMSVKTANASTFKCQVQGIQARDGSFEPQTKYWMEIISPIAVNTVNGSVSFGGRRFLSWQIVQGGDTGNDWILKRGSGLIGADALPIPAQVKPKNIHII